MNKPTNQRLESLDVLRGFDLFCLVALERVLAQISHATDASWFDKFMWNFRHVEWEGFSSWDLVMPLFMFMAGTSIPFALSRYKTASKKPVYKRIIKRVILLWIFGIIYQGNLLGLNPDEIYLYSNTLQAIAMGYLIAAMLFLHTRKTTQIISIGVLLLLYWGAMEFITVGSYGGGNYTPDANLAEWLDRVILGRFRDGAKVIDGVVVFSSEYYHHYTWILSSLNFGATVLTGVIAGHILRDKKIKQFNKVFWLTGIGVAMVAAGWLWHLQMPVIKKIWTSSMVLVSSGYCFLLMALFYYVIDYKGYKKYTGWLKVYGMNSIAAYMIAGCINFSCISKSLFFGLEQYMGLYYQVLIAASNAVIVFLILNFMYKRKIFLKV